MESHSKTLRILDCAMAQVSLPPSGPYSRRVSFNNLHPDDLESGTSKFYQYDMESTPATHTAELEVSKMFGNYSLGSLIGGSSRKRVKLPDPPLKLILKNKLTPCQLLQNLQHALLQGVNYHGDLNDMIQHPLDVPQLESGGVVIDKSPNESDDENDDIVVAPAMPTARRKLYSQMTDEELMALDPQFSKPRTSSLESFKFDSSTTYYSNNRRVASSGTVASQVLTKQIVYPSLNENNYKSMSLTVRHQEYDVDTTASRTLLTVISGRKHTWNSLDWLLLTDKSVKQNPVFLQDGDYLVVAGLVPLKFMDGNSDQKRQHCIDDKLYQKCDRLLKYVLNKLPDRLLRLKITVEFVLDVAPSDPLALKYKKNLPTGNRFMLTHLFKQYQPTLVIIGNKSTNLNFKYPLRKQRQKSTATPAQNLPTVLGKIQLAPPQATDLAADAHLIKLSSFLIKYSTVPLILVGNATIFHQKPELKQNVAVTFTDSKPSQSSKGILDVPPDQHRKNSATSNVSIESFTGNIYSNSSLSLESPEDLLESLDFISHSQTETRFADMLSSVSLYSLSHLRNYLSAVKDENIERLSPQLLNSKVHKVYSSLGNNKSGTSAKSLSNGGPGKAYKVKSLISYSEEEEKRNEKMINEKKLKKSVSRSSIGSLKSSDDKKPTKKKSFLQKLGVKK